MNGTEVVATTGDAAFAVDPEGRIIAWNEGAEYCLGYRRPEVLGRRCWRVLQGQDLSSNRYCDRTCPVRNMAMKGEPINRTQMFFRNASGETTPVAMSTLVVQGEKSKEIVHLFQCLSSDAQETMVPLNMPAASSNAPLSVRQLEVLKHLADGKSTEEIAELLCIAEVTARHHIQHILSRLKVHSRLEAVALARRIGLL
jgi:PAS domain S-box-containing protein